MMRITAFIFSLFYLISSVGYGVEVHYCLGQVADVNHFLFETHCPCDVGHAEVENQCCEERSVFQQIDEEHSVPVKLQMDKVELPLIGTLDLELLQEEVAANASLEVLVDRGPPQVRDLTLELVRLITYG